MEQPFQTGSTLDSFGGLLTSLGRGDWVNQLPNNKPSLLGVLDFFNSWVLCPRHRMAQPGDAKPPLAPS